MLDQSIGGIINDFYDEDFDCDSERSPLIRKSERGNSAGSQALIQQLIIDSRSRRSTRSRQSR